MYNEIVTWLTADVNLFFVNIRRMTLHYHKEKSRRAPIHPTAIASSHIAPLPGAAANTRAAPGRRDGVDERTQREIARDFNISAPTCPASRSGR